MGIWKELHATLLPADVRFNPINHYYNLDRWFVWQRNTKSEEEKKEGTNEENPISVSPIIPTQKIEVTESISTVREEQPEQPVKKRRGRKKKIQIL